MVIVVEEENEDDPSIVRVNYTSTNVNGAPTSEAASRRNAAVGVLRNCHKHNSDQSPNVLVGPGVENQVQLAAIDCRSVACVLEEQKREVTREGPRGPRVSMKSGVSGVFPEWFREVQSSGELWSYRVGEVRRSES